MDVLTKEQRHKNMVAIKSRDTKIEVSLRKALRHRGVRYRKNMKLFNCHPDIVITKQGGEDKKVLPKTPVADFYCPHCAEEYEIKSKSRPIANKVNDGAYKTMIERIEAINNPNFFFLQYSKRELYVKNLIVVSNSIISGQLAIGKLIA